MEQLLLILISLVLVQSEKKCTCVPYYNCSEESNNIITDGNGLLDFRIIGNDACDGYFDVCCNVTIELKTKPKIKQYKGCGYKNNWSVALLLRDDITMMLEFKCGASLIHQNVILTAAHCFSDAENGIWVIQVGNIIRDVKKIIIHPHFNEGSLQNDIAVLILTAPITEVEYINTICLPPPGLINDNDDCFINDWRYRNFIKISKKLKTVTKTKCEKLLQQTRLGEYFQLDESFICASGNKFEDPCGNDGGSPLICPAPSQPGRYHQIGIVSWGIGCGEDNIPGVYVNLELFREWIDEVFLKYGYNINTYRY